MMIKKQSKSIQKAKNGYASEEDSWVADLEKKENQKVNFNNLDSATKEKMRQTIGEHVSLSLYSKEDKHEQQINPLVMEIDPYLLNPLISQQNNF